MNCQGLRIDVNRAQPAIGMRDTPAIYIYIYIYNMQFEGGMHMQQYAVVGYFFVILGF